MAFAVVGALLVAAVAYAATRSILADGPIGRDAGTGSGGDVAVTPIERDPLAGAGGGAAAGAAGGFATFGPIGAVVGAVIGGAIGLISEAASFGSDVRRAVKRWLRDGGQSDDNANADAVLLRWGLLRIGKVYRKGDRIAVRVAATERNERRIGGVDLRWEGFDRTISGVRQLQKAGEDVAETIRYGLSEIMDPAAKRVRERDSYETFKRGARVGDLYAIDLLADGGPLSPTFPAPPRTAVYTSRVRPRLDYQRPIRDSRGWEPTTVTIMNVNDVAEPWDRAIGADWST